MPTWLGGGAMFDLGCHIVDIMRWFMGPPKSVVAKINNLTNAYPIDDNSAVVVEFESGALGVLECSWAQRRGPRPMEIYGTDGYVGRDPFGGVILASAALDPQGVQGLIRVEKLPEAQPHPMDQWVSAMLHDTPMTITRRGWPQPHRADGGHVRRLARGARISLLALCRGSRQLAGGCPECLTTPGALACGQAYQSARVSGKPLAPPSPGLSSSVW